MVSARPTHKNISALPAVGVTMFYSNVHGHSEKDIGYWPCVLQTREKSQMITNEGGRAISMNMFITKRSGQFPLLTQ